MNTAELAKRSGIGRSRLRRVLAGEERMFVDELMQLSHALEVSPTDLGWSADQLRDLDRRNGRDPSDIELLTVRSLDELKQHGTYRAVREQLQEQLGERIQLKARGWNDLYETLQELRELRGTDTSEPEPAPAADADDDETSAIRLVPPDPAEPGGPRVLEFDTLGNPVEQLVRAGFELGVTFLFWARLERLGDSGVPEHVLDDNRARGDLLIRLDAEFHRFNQPVFGEDGVTLTLGFDQLYDCTFPWPAIHKVIFDLESVIEEQPSDPKGRPRLRLVT